MDKPVEILWKSCGGIVHNSEKKIVWDMGEMTLHCLDADWMEEFEGRWIGELGADLYSLQVRKAEHWLAVRPQRRSSRSNLTLFLNNWMISAMDRQRKNRWD